MGAAVKLFDTKTLTKEEWKEARHNGIGGSDVAAICGLNPWRSALSVYLEKTGQIDGVEENEAMRWGTILEPIIAKEFEERTGLKVRNNNYILQHPEHPFMLANLDREIVGEKAGLEIKTTSAFNGGKMHKDIPDYYYLQCLHYMAVTGYDRWHLAILVGGNQLHIHTIERDDEDIKNLIKIESDFWNNYIVAGVMPEATAQDTDTVKALYKDIDESKEVFLPADAMSHIQQFKGAQELIKTGERLKDEAVNNIKLLMGDAGTAIYDTFKITNKVISSDRFDTKGFRKAHGDLADKFTQTSTYTRFDIKEMK